MWERVQDSSCVEDHVYLGGKDLGEPSTFKKGLVYARQYYQD